MFQQFLKKPRNLKDDIFSGITVSLALVPEAVAFAFVAGVDPLVGLYAAFFVGLVTAIFGGRPGMISGATGAMAVVMTPFVMLYGTEYLFAAVVLTGVIQILAGVLKLGKFIRLLPHPVMLGFVNGLAIVIGLAQLGQFKKGHSVVFEEAEQIFVVASHWMSLTDPALWVFLALIAITMGIGYLLPKLTRAVPAPLVAIIACTLLSQFVPLFHSKTVAEEVDAQRILAAGNRSNRSSLTPPSRTHPTESYPSEDTPLPPPSCRQRPWARYPKGSAPACPAFICRASTGAIWAPSRRS